MYSLKNKRVLVTGGAGFIGSHTVDALIENEANVVVIDNLLTGRESNLNPKAKFYKLNINSSTLEMILEKEKPQIVYHFAFFVLVPKSTENPILDLDCLNGSVRMLKKLAELKTVEKFLFASSGFVYGNNSKLPLKETEPVEALSSYAISKITIENYLKFFNKVFGIPYVILRYATVYGPRQITGALADYIRKLSNNQPAEIYGDGTKTRDYVYIDDVVKANLLALNLSGNIKEPIFNIGTSKETTLNEVYTKIAILLGKDIKPIYYPDRAAEQIKYSLNYSKIKKELNWSPKINLDEGLKKWIDTVHISAL